MSAENKMVMRKSRWRTPRAEAAELHTTNYSLRTPSENAQAHPARLKEQSKLHKYIYIYIYI